MPLAHRIVRVIARRASESRRPFPWRKLEDVVSAVEEMATAIDASAVGYARNAQESAHNHGYGYYGLRRGCVTEAGTVQKTEGGAEAELLGRNLPRTYLHWSGWLAPSFSGGPNTAFGLPAYDAQIARTNKRGQGNTIFDNEELDIEGLAPVGCIKSTVSVWFGISAIDTTGSAEFPGVTVRVQTAADDQIGYDSFSGGRQFFPAATRRYANTSFVELRVIRVDVPDVPTAPGAWNRFRLSFFHNADVNIAGLFVCQINVTEQENTG